MRRVLLVLDVTRIVSGFVLMWKLVGSVPSEYEKELNRVLYELEPWLLGGLVSIIR